MQLQVTHATSHTPARVENRVADADLPVVFEGGGFYNGDRNKNGAHAGGNLNVRP